MYMILPYLDIDQLLSANGFGRRFCAMIALFLFSDKSKSQNAKGSLVEVRSFVEWKAPTRDLCAKYPEKMVGPTVPLLRPVLAKVGAIVW